ncbi:MAG: RNA polymerase sigma factor [Bacteroidia bacterium]|nr:RNA polymerase sigma factor [Bacteroidia bacterium]
MNVSEFNTCVDEHSNGLYRFVLKNLRDSDQARDIVQDTFEKIWLKVDTIPFEKAKSYLYTTAYHTMIDKIRKQKFETQIEEHHEELVMTNSSFSDLKKVLDKALATLSEIQRSVVLLRDYEGYSYEEIGEITGLNESQVKVYIYRARLALKNYIGSLENVV